MVEGCSSVSTVPNVNTYVGPESDESVAVLPHAHSANIIIAVRIMAIGFFIFLSPLHCVDLLIC